VDDESFDIDGLLNRYASRYRVEFTTRLGDGKDGSVFSTTLGHAVKFLRRRLDYTRELRAYLVLQEQQVVEIEFFQIPQLLRFDDELFAVEMTIVRPPFLLDFVSSYTDEEIEWLNFTEDVLTERETFWEERFGERWPVVARLRDSFHMLTGLTLLDLSHNNIRFE